jgi:hypothetical protein
VQLAHSPHECRPFHARLVRVAQDGVIFMGSDALERCHGGLGRLDEHIRQSET